MTQTGIAKCFGGVGGVKCASGVGWAACPGPCPRCTVSRVACWEVTFDDIAVCCAIIGAFQNVKLVDIAPLLEVPFILFPFGGTAGIAYYGLASTNAYLNDNCTTLTGPDSDRAAFNIFTGPPPQFALNGSVGAAGFFTSATGPATSTLFTKSNEHPACGTGIANFGGTGGTATVRVICGVPLLALSGDPPGSLTSVSFTSAGGSQDIDVQMCKEDDEWFLGMANMFGADSGIPTVNSPDDFLTLSVTSGIGNGSFTITADVNDTGSSRDAKIWVNGVTFSVTQAA